MKLAVDYLQSSTNIVAHCGTSYGFPEPAGFVFWSDEKFYNVTGNLNATEFMSGPKIITLK